jgi:formylglycine-generating enzyme required for sulfatase activity
LNTKHFPVERVSWDDCQQFLEKINMREGIAKVFGKDGKFTLPHEEQWEYACRGGKGNQQPYYWGAKLNGTEANCDGNYPLGTTTKGQYLERTCAVDFTNNGKYKKHPWGLAHMTGNVCQWCENKYGDEERVFRGGAWYATPSGCRTACRRWISPRIHGSITGFRVALAPSGQ